MDNNLNLLVVDEGNRRVARFDNRLNDSLDQPELYETFVKAGGEIADLYERREFGRAVREIMALADLAGHAEPAGRVVWGHCVDLGADVVEGAGGRGRRGLRVRQRRRLLQL